MAPTADEIDVPLERIRERSPPGFEVGRILAIIEFAAYYKGDSEKLLRMFVPKRLLVDRDGSMIAEVGTATTPVAVTGKARP